VNRHCRFRGLRRAARAVSVAWSSPCCRRRRGSRSPSPPAALASTPRRESRPVPRDPVVLDFHGLISLSPSSRHQRFPPIEAGDVNREARRTRRRKEREMIVFILSPVFLRGLRASGQIVIPSVSANGYWPIGAGAFRRCGFRAAPFGQGCAFGRAGASRLTRTRGMKSSTWTRPALGEDEDAVVISNNDVAGLTITPPQRTGTFVRRQSRARVVTARAAPRRH